MKKKKIEKKKLIIGSVQITQSPSKYIIPLFVKGELSIIKAIHLT